MLERLQKIISAAGITSRRASEALIVNGQVAVNGVVVTELGSKADPSKDTITIDGKVLKMDVKVGDKFNPSIRKKTLILTMPIAAAVIALIQYLARAAYKPPRYALVQTGAG